MKPARYSASRQKACQQCSASKAKCDRLESGCSRCVQRALHCEYPQAAFPRRSARASSAAEEQLRIASQTAVIGPVVGNVAPYYGDIGGSGSVHAVTRLTPPGVEGDVTTLSKSSTDAHHLVDLGLAAAQRSNEPEIQGFRDLRLMCPINAEGIANRWLRAYVPLPDEKVKEYPATTKSFLHRIIKSYITLTIRGRGYPPFVHASQVAVHHIRPPLSTCLSLVRICENQLPGSQGVAAEVLQREMRNLYQRRDAYDTITLLCAFQAYLILTMVLFFRLGQITDPFLRQAVVNLQELACMCAKRGLVCEAEQQWLRPQWESWIVAEAARRTLYTMYLFDGILSAHDGLPTFVGTELKGLPAPAGRRLWRALGRLDWETSYNSYLAEWDEGGLRIDELWSAPADFDDADVLKRRDRVDRWLEDVDEFGTMLYAVTSSTHG